MVGTGWCYRKKGSYRINFENGEVSDFSCQRSLLLISSLLSMAISTDLTFGNNNLKHLRYWRKHILWWKAINHLYNIHYFSRYVPSLPLGKICHCSCSCSYLGQTRYGYHPCSSIALAVLSNATRCCGPGCTIRTPKDLPCYVLPCIIELKKKR